MDVWKNTVIEGAANAKALRQEHGSQCDWSKSEQWKIGKSERQKQRGQKVVFWLYTERNGKPLKVFSR